MERVPSFFPFLLFHFFLGLTSHWTVRVWWLFGFLPFLLSSSPQIPPDYGYGGLLPRGTLSMLWLSTENQQESDSVPTGYQHAMNRLPTYNRHVFHACLGAETKNGLVASFPKSYTFPIAFLLPLKGECQADPKDLS